MKFQPILPPPWAPKAGDVLPNGATVYLVKPLEVLGEVECVVLCHYPGFGWGVWRYTPLGGCLYGEYKTSFEAAAKRWVERDPPKKEGEE